MPSARPLDLRDFSTVTRLAPLVSLDIIVRDDNHRVLLGLRNNEPARGFYFVPGGRVWKDERLSDAFARIVASETSCRINFNEAKPLGSFEHFYPNNRFGDPDYGTHYIVLAYEIQLKDISAIKADAQHREYIWMGESELLASPQVHENTKAYLRAPTHR